jgi:hypothetical protein
MPGSLNSANKGGALVNTLSRMASELSKESGRSERITRKRLIDVLNHSNFQRQSIIVTVEHVPTNASLTFRASPQPCLGETVTCLWSEPVPSDIAASYRCRGFMVDRGRSLLIADAGVRSITDAGVSFDLPEYCKAVHPRQFRRYTPERIRASLSFNGAILQGVLEDFSTQSFRVRVSAKPLHAVRRISSGVPVFFTLFDGADIIYSAECKTVRHASFGREREFVLVPTPNRNDLPSADGLDTLGYMLAPKPDVIFEHPFTKTRTVLELFEISHSWFSILEYYDRSTLCPGLVIPGVEVQIAFGFSIRCKVQVRSGNVAGNSGANVIKWLIAVVQIDEEDQARLFKLLQKVADQKSYGSGKVDVSELISFFFDTGFVYPKKYVALEPYKEQFVETYKRLYLESPTIARHFVQQDKGSILGHLSMVRFYENTWLIHHHAAIGQHSAGLNVLTQITDYIEDYREFASTHLHYLMCYFRPENRFPQRVFGGFTRSLHDRRACSIDTFGYTTLRFRETESSSESSWGWIVDTASRDDLVKLHHSYQSASGGLLLEAMDLQPGMVGTDGLSREYGTLGFKRQKHIMSLKKGGVLRAVILATLSDVGLNMSNLTNCLHVFLVNSTRHSDLSFGQLCQQLAQVGQYYEEDEVPLLVYPCTYLVDHAIPYEKAYNTMVLDSTHITDFKEYMRKLFWRKKSNSDTRQP